MLCSDKWTDYELIDCSDGERLERWGGYTLVRPDPQVIWKNCRLAKEWARPDGRYIRRGGGGDWSPDGRFPEKWTIGYERLGLRFEIRPMGFKHVGLFPEQAVNWEWIHETISGAGREVRILNLFAYTGGATVAAASAGASVCHVDASKGMVAYAKRNAELSGLSSAHIRYIVDDCVKFCEREKRRGNRYDGVIMDPPSYGRGPGGEKWTLEDSVDGLVGLASELLTPEPLFFILNSYTTGLSAATTGYVLMKNLSRLGGTVESHELGLPVSATGGILPSGSTSRWKA